MLLNYCKQHSAKAAMHEPRTQALHKLIHPMHPTPSKYRDSYMIPICFSLSHQFVRVLCI